MTRIILSGCFGRMGGVITGCVQERSDCEIVAGVDIGSGTADFPVYKSFADVQESADVLIDFSHPSALDGILSYVTEKKIPAVMATTGYTPAQVENLKATSGVIPLFFSANMSIGVNLIAELAAKAARVLEGSFDVEIVEMHHNQKIDAPSGTALMLADTISDAMQSKPHYEFDRHSKRAKRDKNEIGIHAVRGGTIVGEHQVIFAGLDEIITISHSARSKELFAVGALNAALFLQGKAPGLYSMRELIAEK